MRKAEKHFPLKVLVCETCWLVQAESYSQAAELFNDEYAYFSSFSTEWLEHSKRYVNDMVTRFGYSSSSTVVEIAANDGYLLQYVKERNIPCYGVEPTRNTAIAARQKGIEIIERFFGQDLAKELAAAGRSADLMIANNVLAHVPDIADFVLGYATLLKPNGVATFEFPHLYRLIVENQFDTIYHEHFSYLSFTVVRDIFAENGLNIFDVENLVTHGGSLRVFAQRSDHGTHEETPAVADLVNLELHSGVRSLTFYRDFQMRADQAKNRFMEFLLTAKFEGKKVAGYGAAAKGNTLLNYAGVRPDLIPFVVDRNPAKQGRFMPGSRIPIVKEDVLATERPDYVVIFPWNLSAEVKEQLRYVRGWGAKFVTAVPNLEID
jgi:SAM-dependent methyltransferase